MKRIVRDYGSYKEYNVNAIEEFAKKQGRDYITPEDVSYFLASSPKNIEKIRVDVLHMIGRKKAEDPSLCAYIAWKG